MDSTLLRYSHPRLAFLLLLAYLIGPLHAEPAIWEPDFGAELLTLSGADDSAENVVLGFEFPMLGETYTVVSVNNNGGVALGNDPGQALVIQWHHWHRNSFQLDFTAVGFPSLVAFNTDLDQTSTGVVYFNDLGDRAVFTWDGVGTNRTPGAPFITFQIHLFADGRFAYAYQGIEGDLIADLDEGIVVGFSDGSGAPPSGSVDFTASPMSVLATTYEIWCYNEDPAGDPAASNCYEPGRDNNAGFDLDQEQTLLFEPDATGGTGGGGGQGGFLVSNQPPVVVQPPPPEPPPPTSGGGGGGGGNGPALLLLLVSAFLVRRVPSRR